MKTLYKIDGAIPVTSEMHTKAAACEVALIDMPCSTADDIAARCGNADGLLLIREPVTAAVIEALPSLRVISKFGIGLDSIDLDAAEKAGIVVANVPDANVEEVASHALAMALALNRRLAAFDRSVRAGKWDVLTVGAGMRRDTARTFGLLGLGRIGSIVARHAQALGFNVIACDPHGPSLSGIQSVELEELLRRSDVLSLHVPLVDDTRGIIDAAALSVMRRGAVLVNVSRGELVDETALAQALHSGQLAGAGLDVFAQEPLPAESPLREAPNIILTPHAAHWSLESFADTVDRALENALQILRSPQAAVPE